MKTPGPPGNAPAAGGSPIERKADAVGSGRTTVIEPPRGWRMLDLGEIWAYRELLAVLVLRDVTVRYKQTLLGAAWVILRPLGSLVLFTVVFGLLVKVPSDGRPYALFVFSALLPWTLFSGAVGASGNSLLGSAGLIGKIYFPRLIVPLASVGSSLVDFAVSMVFLLALMPFFGAAWGPGLLMVPALLAGVLLLALGVGTLFSALIVAHRDFAGAMGYLLQAWMYATPVVYPASLVPERWRWVLALNPMTGFVGGFRSAVFGGPFDAGELGASFAFAAAAFAAGVAYFERAERTFADVI